MFIAKIAAALFLALLGTVTVIFSDIYIRAGDRDGLNGVDAQAYDVTGSILLLIGVAMTCYLVFSATALKRIGLALWIGFVAVFLINLFR